MLICPECCWNQWLVFPTRQVCGRCGYMFADAADQAVAEDLAEEAEPAKPKLQVYLSKNSAGKHQAFTFDGETMTRVTIGHAMYLLRNDLATQIHRHPRN